MSDQSLSRSKAVPSDAPSGDAVRAQLARVLASAQLQRSEKRRAFLRFVVDETLAGRGGRLKGYTVAVAVYGRDETFDSQTDPVVRLDAGRLRRDLDSYYVDAGSRDPIRITIPKGAYAAQFAWNPPAQDRPATGEPSTVEPVPNNAEVRAVSQHKGHTSRRNGLIAAAVATLVAIAVVAGVLRTGEETPKHAEIQIGPAVVVLPFDPLSASDNNRHLARGLTAELVDDLLRFPGLRLYTLPASFDTDSVQELITSARELGVAYVINGHVTLESGTIHVGAQLLDARTGAVLWSEHYDRPLTPEGLTRTHTELAGEIAEVLGQPYGVINTVLDDADAPLHANLESYMCVQRAYAYRRDFSAAQFGPVLGCLEAAVQRDPEYGDAWAMLGWLYLDGGRYELAGREDPQGQYEKAVRAATRAISLDPDNTLALKALSAVNHHIGRFDEGERMVRRAAEINPYDPDTLAQLGWRLAARGKFEEGIPILRNAIDRTINPPGWYFHFIAIELCMKQDYRQMLEIADRSAVDGSEFSQVLIAIANAKLGNRDAVKHALENIPKQGVVARDLPGFLRRHGATDEIVDALETRLNEAKSLALGI